VDTVEGFTDILTDLHEYGIRASFFVNGEFMRRNPDAVRELADSGHEVGSLFFSYFNMTDARYRITRDFIKQGLARNEDQYFKLTAGEGRQGKELALLWHAPYYFVNSEIIAASREMNYTYVGYDVDPLDWVPRDDEGGGMYLPVPDLVERLMAKKKPGSIIPIRIGIVNGGREDYLFQHLDLLINGLISRGYRVVPVSTLIEHAK
jgi:peptidoglycan/xylan/chitin deacetylase (PgdA/CDA1 family)